MEDEPPEDEWQFMSSMVDCIPAISEVDYVYLGLPLPSPGTVVSASLD